MAFLILAKYLAQYLMIKTNHIKFCDAVRLDGLLNGMGDAMLNASSC